MLAAEGRTWLLYIVPAIAHLNHGVSEYFINWFLIVDIFQLKSNNIRTIFIDKHLFTNLLNLSILVRCLEAKKSIQGNDITECS